jgi:ABC-type lipoprotein release transport system permease subunit
MVAGFEAAPFLATASALGLLFCTGVLTCLVPALQAARVNPTVALREE